MRLRACKLGGRVGQPGLHITFEHVVSVRDVEDDENENENEDRVLVLTWILITFVEHPS